jgi:hypothetical protein
MKLMERILAFRPALASKDAIFEAVSGIDGIEVRSHGMSFIEVRFPYFLARKVQALSEALGFDVCSMDVGIGRIDEPYFV